MRWRKFLVANAAGGILWAGIYTLAAYLAGNALQRVSGTIDLVIFAVAVVAIAGVLFFVRRQIARIGVRAEAAYLRPVE
jgi:membrane protein DedA with SNARE-associated domain